MDEELGMIFTTEEVQEALNQMSPLKSLGLDGFVVGFYQQHWSIVKNDVCSAALDFLNNGIIIPTLNFTYIALIPKVNNPEVVEEFRPISLCNVLYKIVSKTISNRLKKRLLDIIACSQSALMPGRLISDKIMVAFEVLHTMKTK